MICAGVSELGTSADTCKGDSGSAMMVLNSGQYELVGVTSWGKPPCTSKGFPSVFTSIPYHLEWIKNPQNSKFVELKSDLKTFLTATYLNEPHFKALNVEIRKDSKILATMIDTENGQDTITHPFQQPFEENFNIDISIHGTKFSLLPGKAANNEKQGILVLVWPFDITLCSVIRCGVPKRSTEVVGDAEAQEYPWQVSPYPYRQCI